MAPVVDKVGVTSGRGDESGEGLSAQEAPSKIASAISGMSLIH